MRRSDLALSAGLGLALALAVGLAIVPQFRRERDLSFQIDGLRAELAKPNDGPELVRRLEQDLATLRDFGKGRMTPIPAESEVAGLMKSISATLDSLGLDKRDITTRTPKQFEGASSMPVTITLVGPFLKIHAAVECIESLPRLVRVERFRTALEDAKSGALSRSGLVRAELSIDAFYEPTGSSEPDGAARASASADTAPGGNGR